MTNPLDQRQAGPEPSRRHDQDVARRLKPGWASPMLVRIAALAAVDAPPSSYLVNLGAAADLDIDAEQVTGVLAAIAPIIGPARVAAAARHLLIALGAAIKLDELRELAEADAD